MATKNSSTSSNGPYKKTRSTTFLLAPNLPCSIWLPNLIAFQAGHWGHVASSAKCRAALVVANLNAFLTSAFQRSIPHPLKIHQPILSGSGPEVSACEKYTNQLCQYGSTIDPTGRWLKYTAASVSYSTSCISSWLCEIAGGCDLSPLCGWRIVQVGHGWMVRNGEETASMAGSLTNITNIPGLSHTDNRNNNNYASEKIWHFMHLSVCVCAMYSSILMFDIC